MLVDLHAQLQFSIDHTALRAVDRAMADLRRGEFVVIGGEEDQAALALAVEAVSPETLDALARLAEAPPMLVVTRRRAAALGMAEDGPGNVILEPGAGALDAEAIRRLTDPTLAGFPDSLPAVTVAAAAVTPCGMAAVALAKLSRLLPAAMVSPIRLDGATPAAWATREDLMPVAAGDVMDYQVHAARSLRRVAEAQVPLADAEKTRLVAFRPTTGGPEHLAIVIGDPDPADPVLARLHSECFTGDLLGSLRCDCGDQLRGAIAEIARLGSGVLLYLAQEGRGIGLVNKLRAYRLQDGGIDTVDANEALGFEADERVYLPAAEMLRQLGFSAVRLMTNNPDKLRQLARCGIEVVERVPHIFPANGHNEAYLRTKAIKSGHLF
ncbi:MAG TPA: GTP cyclohydrolase II [Azospirillaceae bacterium]|nr:GTP cyclohydrolase II [Azospirillaceae bacterium]